MKECCGKCSTGNQSPILCFPQHLLTLWAYGESRMRDLAPWAQAPYVWAWSKCGKGSTASGISPWCCASGGTGSPGSGSLILASLHWQAPDGMCVSCYVHLAWQDAQFFGSRIKLIRSHSKINVCCGPNSCISTQFKLNLINLTLI